MTAVQPRSTQRSYAYTCAVYALPGSLATTTGISVDVFSSGYLDVSVHRVCSTATIGFIAEYVTMTPRGLPHSEISGSSLVGSSPKLIAACYVLHRLSCQGIHLCALIYLLTRS